MEVVTGPEADAIKAALAAYTRSSEYLRLNHSSLLERFAEQWIAVDGEGVVAEGTTFHDLLREVRSMERDAGELAFAFITRHPDTLVLVRG